MQGWRGRDLALDEVYLELPMHAVLLPRLLLLLQQLVLSVRSHSVILNGDHEPTLSPTDPVPRAY